MSQEKFFTTRNATIGASGHKIPTAPRNMARPARWIPPGETVEVLDYIIRGGMLYVGTGMKDPNGTPEPSLINPLCPVQPTYGSYSTRSLDYWPNYSAIAPEARGAYLSWLASGRSDPGIDIGFIFLYFYGLERRAFIDSYADSRAQEEWPQLIAEVQRLRKIYGAVNHAFDDRASRFLDMLQAAKNAKNLAIGQGRYSHGTAAMSLDLKIELGKLALAQKPLPVQQAFSWAQNDPGLTRGTAVNRCHHWFQKLFVRFYSEQYDSGLILPITKTKLMMLYEPASQAVAGFGEIGLYLDELPDVTIEGGTSVKLQALIDRCDDHLSNYSRFIGRHPDLRHSVEALVLLPQVLWPESLRGAIDAWVKRVEGGPCVTTPAELLTSFTAPATNLKDLLPILNALSTFDIRTEPEFSGRMPKLDDPIALFQVESEAQDEFSRTKPAYIAARVTLQLAHFVALADGAVKLDVPEFIAQQAASWVHLTRAHRARLVAYSHYLCVVPTSLATLKKNIVGLEPLARNSIAAFLCRVAQAGQDASPAAVKLLAKLYKLLELDAERLHSHLHAAASGSSTDIASDNATSPVLDTAKIAALQKDTAAVSAMLADIFVEDDEAVQAEPAIRAQTGTAPGAEGALWSLDAAHSTLARQMLTQSAWSRAELLPLASTLGLMLDGALEQINEAAFDTLDMPFVEGDDPFEINPDLPKDLTQ